MNNDNNFNNNGNNMNNNFNNNNMSNNFNNDNNMNNNYNNNNMSNNFNNNNNMNNNFNNNNMNNNFNNNNMNNNFNNNGNNMNNGYNNNMNNNFNNNDNNMNNNMNGTNNQNNKLQISGKTKKILIIVGILVALFIIGKFAGGDKTTSDGTSTSSTSSGSSEKANYVCELVNTYSDRTATNRIEIIFNKDYQIKTNKTTKVVYNTTLTDDMYFDYVSNTTKATRCVISPDECKASNLELGITDYGWNTKVVRSGNTITVTGYTAQGQGQTVSKSYQKELIDEFRTQGFTCK